MLNPETSTQKQAWQPPQWLKPQLYPFTHRFCEIDGHRIHYLDEGEGEVILFLHGNPAWSFLFRKVVPLLSGHYRCVALDYPGFGLSTAKPGYDFLPESHAAVVAAFIENHGLANVTLAVSDWGGPIGLSVAAAKPESAVRLVIGNTFAWPVNDDPHFVRFSRFFGGPLGRFLVRHLNLFVNALIPAGVRKAKLSADEMTAYRMPFPDAERRMPTHIFPREILGSQRFLAELAKALPRLRDKPALLLWADKDIAFREKELNRFESIFARRTTERLTEAGHFLWEDEPEKIAAAIVAFVRANPIDDKDAHVGVHRGR